MSGIKTPPRTDDAREMRLWTQKIYQALNIDAVADATVDLSVVVARFNELLANMRKAGLLKE